MPRPSKGAAVFLVIFGLVFLIPGLLAFYAFVIGSRNLESTGKLFGGAIAIFFAAIGAGLIYMAFSGYRKQQRQAALQDANPSSPWLWREDWAARTAKSQNRGKEITLWVVTIFVNMIVLPIEVSVLPNMIGKADPRALILLGFAAVGLILMGYAVRATVRHGRYGNTFFEFDSLPFSPGAHLTGRIHFKFDGNPGHGVDLRLSCVRRVVTGSGEDRTTNETVLWQAGYNVPCTNIGMDSSGRTIPVDFEIPADAWATNRDDFRDQVLWMLHAKAEMPGVNYSDVFEVPVFQTSSSPGDTTTESSFGFSRLQSTFGFAQTAASRHGRPQLRAQAQSRTSTVASLVVFLAVAVGMFVWQGSRFSTLKSLANSRAAGSNPLPAPASRPGSASTPPVKAMTGPEVERVLALPPQAQAEELLERAIGHDETALNLFEQNVESWVGHIRLTDRMKQLEYRSQYSKDLRVRCANADINLTLDGWQKNDQAAEMLIDRARTDLQYRAAAVYFLGMLAGRGVAYDRIHPLLLDYAKNDPDAAVRQWAVEGMRYLGKDEALEELWESFTEDPAMSVRERAGCNISDCGNFTRLQRMRMVPKFLGLLQDSSTNPQMRGWCFMALREITDANVPNDGNAWQKWYGQHGAAKLAEFEKLDWWRVRGDE